jgi:short-subunit dehydrogenase
MHLSGSVVIVTGATRGIGAATARLLASRGATVVGVGRDEAALRHLTADIGGSFVPADLADPLSATTVVTHAMTEHGRLDGVVANAGLGYVGDFAEMPVDQVARLVDVNVRAPMLLARAAVDSMRETVRRHPSARGAFVFVSSIAGEVGVPDESVYSATKAAVTTFAELLREELRQERITVSTVVPGVVSTRFLEERRVPYDRKYPRPIPHERVAHTVVRAMESGRGRLVVPRWLGIPARLSAATPGLYRLLARRFG